jgi:uncharacterized protein YprB with RNaseH-like and TPR domain
MSDNAIDLTKVLFLDIETVPVVPKWTDLDPTMQELWTKKTTYRQEQKGLSADELYSEAGIYSEFGKIICIGVGIIHGVAGSYQYKGKSFASAKEKEVLTGFTELVNEHYSGNGYYLCGHNSREFDFPYIARRCIINGLPLPKPLDIAGKKPWEVGHLDTMQLWKFGDYKHYTSLDLLTHILGIPSPKDEISGADVARVFWEENDLDRIVKYCQKDVLATAQVYLRMQGAPLIKDEHISFV